MKLAWKNSRMGNGCVLILMAIHWLAIDIDAKPQISGSSPRSVQIGAKTEITLQGKLDQWPVEFWCDRPGLKIEAGEKSKVTISVDKDALPGVYLLQAIDSTGASDPLPIIVDRLSATEEKEPNDLVSNANAMGSPGVSVSGILNRSGDVDCFQMTCTKGQLLTAQVRANPLFGTTIDPVLQICDENGFVLDQNDDQVGVDPMLAVQVPRDGKYIVRIFAFPATPNSTVRFAGGNDYRYLLAVSSSPMICAAFPFGQQDSKSAVQGLNALGEVGQPVVRHYRNESALYSSPDIAGFFEVPEVDNDLPSHLDSEKFPAEGLTVPFNLSGMVSEPREIDWVPFLAKKGKKLRIQVDARKLGMDLDPQVAIFDAKGKRLVSKDDQSKADPDVLMDFSPPADGLFYIQIKDAADGGGKRYAYRLRAVPIQPEFELTVKQASFDVEVGKELELEVSVTRNDGFQQPIEISIQGVADSLEHKPVISEPKGDSSKKVILKFKPDKAMKTRIQVIGKSGEQIKKAEFVLSSQRIIREFWVIAHTAKK